MRVANGRLTAVIAAFALAGTLAACSGNSSDTSSAKALAAPSVTSNIVIGSTLSGTVTVYAAASLKPTYEELATQFELANPGVKVETQFAGSADLLTQLENGAPADVFATADTKTMDKAVEKNLVADGGRSDFASNTLTIAVAPGNPKNITGLRDLTKDGINVVVCAPQVPCGAATQKAAAAAGVTLEPVSETNSVTDVVSAVTSGEADAGLVYATDAKSAAGKVEAVDFPEASSAVNVYQIATLKDAENPELAKPFIDLVLSDQGQRVLRNAGFAQP